MLSAYSYCTRVYGRTYRGGGGYGGGGGRGGGGGNSRRDDAEIEKLFESSRNATGINFDKYEEIPVGKHSVMSVFTAEDLLADFVLCVSESHRVAWMHLERQRDLLLKENTCKSLQDMQGAKDRVGSWVRGGRGSEAS